jgi:hypothetical protein
MGNKFFDLIKFKIKSRFRIERERERDLTGSLLRRSGYRAL